MPRQKMLRGRPRAGGAARAGCGARVRGHRLRLHVARADDRPHRVEVWRVGFRPDPWAWANWKCNRRTVPRPLGRRARKPVTVYAAETLAACLLETSSSTDPMAAGDAAMRQRQTGRGSTLSRCRRGQVLMAGEPDGCDRIPPRLHSGVQAAESIASLRPHFIAHALYEIGLARTLTLRHSKTSAPGASPKRWPATSTQSPTSAASPSTPASETAQDVCGPSSRTARQPQDQQPSHRTTESTPVPGRR